MPRVSPNGKGVVCACRGRMYVVSTNASSDGLSVDRKRVCIRCGCVRRTVEVIGNLTEITSLLSYAREMKSAEKALRLADMRALRMESAGEPEPMYAQTRGRVAR